MSRVFYALMPLAGAIVLLVFFFENYHTLSDTMMIQLHFGAALVVIPPMAIPAWVLAILIFVAGFGFAAMMEVMEWVKYRTLVRTQSKRIRRLERELAKYRPAADEGMSADELASDASGAADEA